MLAWSHMTVQRTLSPTYSSTASSTAASTAARLLGALALSGAVFLGACAEGTTGEDPEPTTEPEQEPEPRELGWEEVEGVDQAHQNRWGFVSIDMGGGKAFVFGGADINDFGGEVLGDAFIVDATTNPPTMTDIAVPAELTPRYCGCGAYDSDRNEVMLVGGRALEDFYTDTFIFDVDAETFTKVDAPGPTAVIGCAATYVPSDDATYLFGGGSDAGGLLNEMWKWDPDARTWNAVTYASQDNPIPRYDGAMRELEPGGPLYLFGGFGDGTYLGDTWTFDTSTLEWTNVDAVGPPGRRVPWMVAEPSGEGFYVAFGTYGFQPGEVHRDLWRFDVATGAWEEKTLDTMPPGRGFSQWLPGGPADIGLVLGGFDGANPVPEMWRLKAPDEGGF